MLFLTANFRALHSFKHRNIYKNSLMRKTLEAWSYLLSISCMSAKFSDKGKTNETLCTLKHGNMGKLTATSYLKNKTPSPQKRSYDPPPEE